MLVIHRPQNNPYFNIAAEEYILKSISDDCFMLWRNENSVIVGKNQNTRAEINFPYIEKNNIPVIRRLSGGGCVFHDMGNICFSFTTAYANKENMADNFYLKLIVDFLQSLGLNAHFRGRNDICIEDKKISGNANCVSGGRVLHHGTLLFSSEIKDISQSLNVNSLKFSDKAVQSVRSRVGNISSFLKTPISIEDFMECLEVFVAQHIPHGNRQEFNARQIADIEHLINTKYNTWEWNYGKSPDFAISRYFKSKSAGLIELHLDIKNGRIENIKFYGDYFGIKDVSDLEQLLISAKYQEDEILNIFKTINLHDFFANIEATELITLFFNHE